MNFHPIKNFWIVAPYEDQYGCTYGWLQQGFECRPFVVFDSDGVAMMNYGRYTYTKTESHQYNIGTIGEFALEQALLYQKTKGRSYLDRFMEQVKWLVNNSRERDGMVYWAMDYTYDDVIAPWPSGMVQGLGVSCLTKAFIYTGDKSYMDMARRAVAFYNVPLSEGGFRNQFHGELMFEEYTTGSSKRYGALNGFQISMLGLYDYHRIEQTPQVECWLSECLTCIKKNLDKWEYKKYWSSLYPVESSLSIPIDYHTLHYELMFCLACISGDEWLYEVYKRWACHDISDDAKSLRPGIGDIIREPAYGVLHE